MALLKEPTEINVHCLATRTEWAEGKTAKQVAAEVKKWHTKERGWADNGYHEIIMPDGSTAIGRDLDNDGIGFEDIGAHIRGRNSKSVALALAGGHGGAATDRPEDHYTPAQLATLRRRIEELKDQFPTIYKVSGHNEYANKACPCFNVPEWYEQKPPKKDTPMASNTIKTATGIGVGSVTTVGATVSKLDPMAQQIIVGAIAVAMLAGVVYIITSRRQKQKRGVL